MGKEAGDEGWLTRPDQVGEEIPEGNQEGDKAGE